MSRSTTSALKGNKQRRRRAPRRTGTELLQAILKASGCDGMVWEGQDTYKTLEEAFQDLEAGLGT